MYFPPSGILKSTFFLSKILEVLFQGIDLQLEVYEPVRDGIRDVNVVEKRFVGNSFVLDPYDFAWNADHC